MTQYLIYMAKKEFYRQLYLSYDFCFLAETRVNKPGVTLSAL